MKTTTLKFLVLALFLCFQIPSGLAQKNNSKNEDQNIREFIQIWGLVKYRSQKSIAGRFDADKVFLELIDSVKTADTHQFNQLMCRLSQDQGPKPMVSKQVYHKSKLIDGAYLLNNVDYGWIKNKRYTPLLKEQSTDLTNQINKTGTHQYVPEVFYEGDLPNEPAYPDYTFTAEPMNLLAFAKAWNAIEYLFPYKYVMDKDWEDVLVEMLPVFKEIKDRTSYEKAILKLETALNDTHAGGFMSPESMHTTNAIFNVQYYPPFDYKATKNGLIITQFLSDSLAKQSNLKVGDLLVAINGIKIKQWLKNRSKLLPASNDAVVYRELSTQNNFRGDTFAFSNIQDSILSVMVKGQKKNVNLSLRMLNRKDKENIKIIERHILKEQTKEKEFKGIEAIGDSIILVRAGHVFDKDIPEDKDLPKLSTQLKSKKALIFDMRKYPQSPGFFNYYLPKLLGKTPFKFARYYTADLRQIGIFRYKEELETYMYAPKDGTQPIGNLYSGQIVILTNENTQSMGEWYTMMLQQFSNKTTVIGSQTAGADGDLRRLTLPGDYQFYFTGNGIFYPDGRETQRIGIKPNIYFESSAEDLGSNQDVHLKRALDFIKTGK